MLIYLEDVNKIINTDCIVSVREHVYDTVVDESFLNLKPDEEIKTSMESPADEIDIFLTNNQTVSLNMTVKEFWDIIKDNV